MNTLKLRFLPLLATLVAVCYSATGMAMEISGRVIGVLDADTVYIKSSHQDYRIRLDNIDAPETSCHQWKPSPYESECVEQAQPYGKIAKDFLMDRLYGKTVRVVLVEKDGKPDITYGRLIGTVYLGNVDMNYQVVKNGLAWHYTQFAKLHQPRSAYYAYESAMKYAQQRHLGLWQQQQKPIAPWDFRHAND